MLPDNAVVELRAQFTCGFKARNSSRLRLTRWVGNRDEGMQLPVKAERSSWYRAAFGDTARAGRRR
eukprot:1401798-Prymnesium_polylepis.1